MAIEIPEAGLFLVKKSNDDEFGGYTILAVSTGYIVYVNGDRIYDTKEQFLKQYLRDEKLSQLGI